MHNRKGDTALHLACRGNKQDHLLLLLLSAFPNLISAKNTSGQTILRYSLLQWKYRFNKIINALFPNSLKLHLQSILQLYFLNRMAVHRNQ